MRRVNVLIGIAASAAVSSGITWYVTKRIVSQQYEDRIDEEVKASVAHYLRQVDPTTIVSDEDPDILAERLNDEAINEQVQVIIEAQEYAPTEEVKEVEGERVFGATNEKPPLEDLAHRNNQVEYHKVLTVEKTEEVFPAQEDLPEPPPENPDISIISRDIFMANETEWEQDTITYFNGDGGCTDVNGSFIENHAELIGEGRPRFGEMSDDANVVYVRNKKLEKEFEVISDPGSASEFLVHSLGEMYKPSWLR